jgi:competence protein ComEC
VVGESAWFRLHGADTTNTWLAVLIVAGCAVLVAVAAGGSVGRSRVRGSLPGALAVCLLGLLAGTTLSVAEGHAWLERARVSAGGRGVRGVVVEDTKTTVFGGSVLVASARGPVRVWWPDDAALPEMGQVVEVSGRLEATDLGEGWGRRAARRGVMGTVAATDAKAIGWAKGPTGIVWRFREAAAERLASLDGDGAGLLAGMTLGDRRALRGGPLEADFRIAGLSHLLAVSGLHLALVSVMAGWAARAVRSPRWLQAASCLVVGGGFAVLTGLQASTLRALAMVLASWLASLVGRRGSALGALACAASAAVMLDPWAVFDVSLQLSVAAVGGLLLFGDLVTEWLRRAVPPWTAKLTSLMGATVVAQIATLPLGASLFHQVSLVAPLANALVLPVVGIALPMGLVAHAASGLFATVGTVALRAAAALMEWPAHVAGITAGVSGASFAVATPGALGWLLWIAAGIGLWLGWPLPVSPRRARAGVATVLVAIVVVSMAPGGSGRALEIVMLDIGQGDAILVRDSGQTMLVDTGASVAEMREALGRAQTRRIDCVVLTHAHEDHTGGLDALAGVVSVGWAGMPTAAGGEARKGVAPSVERLTPRGEVAWRGLAAGDGWRVGETTVRVLWPPADGRERDTNDTSLVLELERDGFVAVLTGDAEERALDGIGDAGTLRDLDVLKVPHHGSSNGLSQDALDAWRPEVALVSVGADNDFGHPSPEVLAALDDARTRVFRTDCDGDVTVRVDGGGYAVTRTRR